VLENEAPAGARRLSDEECARVFEEGYKGSNALPDSTGIGLATAARAAHAAAAQVFLSTREDGASGTIYMAYTVVFPVETIPPSALATYATAAPDLEVSGSTAGADPPAMSPAVSPRAPPTIALGIAPCTADAPMANEPTAHAPSPWQPLRDKLSFLLADDLKVNLKMLKITLTKACSKCRFTEVCSGEDALQRLESGDREYDVFVCDNQFGEGMLTGAETIARATAMITKLPRPLLIVSCTADTDASTRNELHQVGARLVWPKPPPRPADIASQLAAELRAVRAQSRG